MLFPLLGRVLRLGDDEDFMTLHDYSFFDLSHALLAFRGWKEVYWSGSSCLGWLSYYFVEVSHKTREVLKVLGRNRVADEEAFPSENLPGVIGTLLSENNIHYCDALSAVTRYRGEIPSPRTSNLNDPVASSEYYGMVTANPTEILRA